MSSPLEASLMEQPMRAGLSVAQGNQAAPPLHASKHPRATGLSVLHGNSNTIASQIGKLGQDYGSNHILKEKCSKDTKVSATTLGAYQTRSVVPDIKPTFEVYCDGGDENNIIHQFEKHCQDENIRRKTEKAKISSNVRKPLSNLPVFPLDFTSDDDEVFTAFPAVPCGPPVFPVDYSGVDVNDDEDAKSSQYGSALDYEVDSRDEYVTAISEKELREDVIYANLEFSEDIYKYMRDREVRIRPKAKYMSRQDDINPEMRAILVDWLSDVMQEYEMHQETLHLAVSIVDRTLSKFRVNRDRLQLVGTTAMMIASKYEEIHPPDLKDFVYVTDSTYTADQILRMERIILNELQFDIGAATSQWFGGRFARHQKATRRTMNAMSMLLDLVLLDIDFLSYRPSYVAAACLCYANVLTGPIPWSTEMENWSGISLLHISSLLRAVHNTFRCSPTSKFKSIPLRYSAPEYDSVSDLPPPARLPL